MPWAILLLFVLFLAFATIVWAAYHLLAAPARSLYFTVSAWKQRRRAKTRLRLS